MPSRPRPVRVAAAHARHREITRDTGKKRREAVDARRTGCNDAEDIDCELSPSPPSP